MTIGQSIQQARKKAGLTQKQLAEKSGIATITLQQYERGVREPKLDTIAKIARAMGLYASDLVDAGQWKHVQPGEEDENFSVAETQLLHHFRNLNDNGQSVAVERVPRYQPTSEIQQTSRTCPAGKTQPINSVPSVVCSDRVSQTYPINPRAQGCPHLSAP